MTKKIRNKIPRLGEQAGKGKDAVIHVKFFTPDSSWTWYATEFDGVDEFFGLVDGFGKEFGYFSLKELQTYTGPIGLHLERDLYFGTPTMGEIYPEFFEKSEISA